MLVNLNNSNGSSHCIYHIEDNFYQQYHYIWGISSSFIINNKRIDNALLIANEFNTYFVSVGQTLDANLAPTSVNPIDFLQPNPCSLVFNHIEETEVATIINSLKIVAQVVMVFQQL